MVSVCIPNEYMYVYIYIYLFDTYLISNSQEKNHLEEKLVIFMCVLHWLYLLLFIPVFSCVLKLLTLKEALLGKEKCDSYLWILMVTV